LYFWAVYHLTNLYMAEHWGAERFILLEGGVYTATFWLGQVLLGGLVPLALFYIRPFSQSRAWLVTGAALVILGGLAQMYVTIIGGQAYPLEIFQGMEVKSSFFDGQVASYTPSSPEVLLGIGGVAIALLMTVVAVRVLPFLPQSLADRDVAA
ncbi:MAG: molybdopterin oxidoreductase, partial [Gammaproteobacteria bacterium]